MVSPANRGLIVDSSGVPLALNKVGLAITIDRIAIDKQPDKGVAVMQKLSKLLKLDINWYSEEGELINILDNCFTIRIYYFQKRNNTTAFSTGIFNYAASGTIDSIFQN